ncbi:MAG: LysE family translocator [Neisseriaceae bacterium]|nr:LysE family translocator [Neisseriaceae bacterium]
MFNLAFLTYIAVMSITPGPNNLMVTASGVNFGFRRTLPHLLGISFGTGLQLFLTANLMAWILIWLEAVRLPLAILGCAYLLWLSWRLLKSDSPEQKEVTRPFSFIQAALFQWINPKAWVMVLNAAILFLPNAPELRFQASIGMALSQISVNLPCVAVWALMGDRLRFFLSQAIYLKAFNALMAVLMSLTALILLYDEFKLAGLI